MKRSPKRFYRHMTREKAEQMRRLYFSRQLNQRELAEMFGVRQHSVSRVISGQVWA